MLLLYIREFVWIAAWVCIIWVTTLIFSSNDLFIEFTYSTNNLDGINVNEILLFSTG